MTGKIPQELGFLSRRILGLLWAARSAHGHFVDYLSRLNHEDVEILCECGEENTPEHTFVCWNLAGSHKTQTRPSHGMEGNIKWIFGTIIGAQAVGNWCKNVNPYRWLAKKYCENSTFIFSICFSNILFVLSTTYFWLIVAWYKK